MSKDLKKLFGAEECKVEVLGVELTVKTPRLSDIADAVDDLASNSKAKRIAALEHLVSVSVYDSEGNRVWDTPEEVAGVKPLVIAELGGKVIDVMGLDGSDPTNGAVVKSSGSRASSTNPRTMSKAGAKKRK